MSSAMSSESSVSIWRSREGCMEVKDGGESKEEEEEELVVLERMG